MHYAVSHGNFDVVSVLLDSKVCNVNQQNKAGYTAIMLVSLAQIRSQTHASVVQRLFQLGDLNIKASQVSGRAGRGGEGDRVDMKTVTRRILQDSEARNQIRRG